MAGVSSERLQVFTTLLDGLSADELSRLSSIVAESAVEAGSVIITEGEAGDKLYLLADGVVDVFRTLTIVTSRNEFGTKERSFSRLSGGDHCFFGETAILGSGERTATVKAVTRCVLFEINADAFRALAAEHPSIGYVMVTNIARMLAGYLRKANDDVIKLTTALSLALSG